MVEQVDCVIAGAGVLGLALAARLAAAGREVLILEAGSQFGAETSARNSGVIHAGIHYPARSLKARACLAGREALYAYCADRGIAHQRCGKLIVAMDEAEARRLSALHDNARACGIADLERWSKAEAQAAEPALSCVGALYSPSTGILDVHAFLTALLADAEAAGALLALHAEVLSGRVENGRTLLNVRSRNGDETRVSAQLFVNCAGHGGHRIARNMAGLAQELVPPHWRAKGSYFATTQKPPFSRLVYPAPVDGGLGVHLTFDLGGAARFGPDVEWLSSEQTDADLRVDPARAEKFYTAIRRYWPALKDGALVPDYAGIRPKLSGPGAPAADFRLIGPAEHGLAGQLHFFGIESPGVTAALALAEIGAQMLGEAPSPVR